MTAADRTPTRLDFTVTRSDSFAESLTFNQSGSALNLTGYTIIAQVRAERDKTAPLLVSFTVGGTLASGVVSLTASAASMTLDPGRYWFEMQWSTGSTVRTVLSGPFVVEPDVAVA